MLTAYVWKEFEIEICGTGPHPAERDVGIMQPYYEFDDVTDVWMTNRRWNRNTGKFEQVRVSLFKDVNLRADDVQAIIRNLRDFIEAEETADAFAEAAE